LNQLTENARQQAATLAKQSEKIDLLQSQILAKTAPKRSDRIDNPEVKKHMQPLEQAQQSISQAKRVFEAHLDGTSPLAHLSEDQIASLKSQMDEGERVVSDRMQFLKDWDTEGFEIASEMLRLREESSRDPAEVSLVSRARKSLAEKRKVSDDSTAPSKEMKTSQNQNLGRNYYQNRNRSPSPGPAWFHPPQPIMFPASNSAFQPYPSPVSAPVYQPSSFFPPPPRAPSPAPGLPLPTSVIPPPRAPSPGLSSSRVSSLQCWTCQQFGHLSANCPNLVTTAANAGKGYFLEDYSRDFMAEEI
jgi:hypothetical protein